MPWEKKGIGVGDRLIHPLGRVTIYKIKDGTIFFKNSSYIGCCNIGQLDLIDKEGKREYQASE